MRSNSERNSENFENLSGEGNTEALGLIKRIAASSRDSSIPCLPQLEISAVGEKSQTVSFHAEGNLQASTERKKFENPEIQATVLAAGSTIKVSAAFADSVTEKNDNTSHDKKDEANKALKQYVESETKRADEYADKHEKGTTLDRALLTIGSLPKDLSISSKPGQLRIESSDFSKVVESIPGAALEATFRKLLGSIKSGTVDGSKVSLEGKTETPIQIDGPSGKMSINLKVNNPSFEVVPDSKNPKCIHLKNINGIAVEKLGIGGDIKEVSFTIENDDSGKSSLRIDIPRPVAAPADPKDKFAFLKKAGASFMPDVSTSRISLDASDSDKIVNRAVDKMRDWVKDPKTNPADLAATIAGVDLKTALDGSLDGIKSISKVNDVIEVKRDKVSTHDLGGLPLELAETVKGKLDANGNALKISQIEGVALNLPVPEEIAKSLGMQSPCKANLKEIELGEADKDGNRILRVKSDSILDTVKLKVDKNLKPIVDVNGQLTLDIAVAQKDLIVNLSLTFNPTKNDKTAETGPDFKVTVNGGDGQYVKLLEQMTGTTVDGPVKDMVKNVRSISKQGDALQISRDGATQHDFGGIALDAGKNIKMKLAREGANGISLSKIEGINVRVPVQLPGIVKDLGIDPGKEVSAHLKSLTVSSSDKSGQRQVLVETDHLLKKAGVILGADMKPAHDSKGNWYMFGIVENPIAQKTMPLALRFDKNNQLAMSTQELMRIGSMAAWQGTENGGLTGAGFGVISVATEAGAFALDVKDAVVDTAVKVKDVTVQAAIVAKDFAVDTALATKDLAVDTALAAKDGVVKGAKFVGNNASRAGRWIKSWFE